ncbi:MAG: tetratricopeptide repeat protein [bacterium]
MKKLKLIRKISPFGRNDIKICLVLLFMFSCILGCRKTQESELNKGLDFFAREEHDSSLAVFNKILEENPKNTEALFYRALIYNKEGDGEDAIWDFEKIFEIDKNFKFKEDQFFSIAEYNYTGRKDYKKAIDLFRLFIQKFPKSRNVARAYVEIADSYSLQKDFDNAVLSYKNIIEVFEKEDSSIGKRAIALAQDAVRFLNENSDFDRKPLSLYADIKNEVDPVKKIGIGKRILKEYPNCNLADDVQFKIAKLYSVEGLNDFDQALKEYKKLVDKYPESNLVKSALNSIRGIEEKYDASLGKLQGDFH